jgi:ribosomal protein S18 acetylase RimI-like enzyme
MNLDEIAHANLVGFTRWSTRLAPDAPVLEDGDSLTVAFPNDWPSNRLAVRVDGAASSGGSATSGGSASEAGAGWVERVDGFLMEHGRTACVYVRAGLDDDLVEPLVASGYHEWSQTPEQVCEAPVEQRTPTGGATVRWAASPADVAAYAAVAGRAFADMGLIEDHVRTLLDRPEVLLDHDVAVALGVREGAVVAGAMVVMVGDETPDHSRHGYVAWVSCLSDARGHGLGDAVTRWVTNEAFARGAGVVTLEASPFGERIYRRMGYRDLYRYRMMIKL